MSSKIRLPRLSPNKRAEILSKHEKGESLDNEDYYVIKDRSGRMNVRRRKAKELPTQTEEAKPEPAPEDKEEVKPKKDPKPKAL